MHYAFEHTEGLRVVSRKVRGNEPSWRLMQRLGMHHDHRLDYMPKGGVEPYLVYSITYEDWEVIGQRIPNTALS